MYCTLVFLRNLVLHVCEIQLLEGYYSPYQYLCIKEQPSASLNKSWELELPPNTIAGKIKLGETSS